MRADRLVAALLIMQARGRVTAGQLAEELEVSVATARRDLEALSGAGIPVYPQPGRGGGWALLGGGRTDLSGLTAPEARALFLLVGPAASGSTEGRAALRKLVRALPATFRAEAEAAAGAVHVDPERWGGLARESERWLEPLQGAVVGRRRVELTYSGRGTRRVDPWGLVDKDGTWYLLAGTDAGRRTFRLDRVEGVTVTDERAAPRDQQALAEQWAEVAERVERSRGRVRAVVVTDRHAAGILRDQFGRQYVELGTEDDGRVRVELGAPLAITIAEQVAGWGARVRVVEPESVRVELARIGAELAAAYVPR